jgi:hypothetical protein
MSWPAGRCVGMWAPGWPMRTGPNGLVVARSRAPLSGAGLQSTGIRQFAGRTPGRPGRPRRDTRGHARIRLATDIGGTFTDLVYLDEATGELGLAKASSTPPAFAQGIMDAIAKSKLDPAGVTHFVHGARHHPRLPRRAADRAFDPA